MFWLVVTTHKTMLEFDMYNIIFQRQHVQRTSLTLIVKLKPEVSMFLLMFAWSQFSLHIEFKRSQTRATGKRIISPDSTAETH